MKKDVIAATAVAVAIVIMVVAMVAMCAGPAAAAPPISDKEDAGWAQNRGYRAVGPCAEAMRVVSARAWERLVSDVFATNRPHGAPVPVTLAVEPPPRGWQTPEFVESMPLELLGKPLIKPRGEVVTFKTEDGTSTCTARYVKTIDQIDDRYDDWDWVIEAVSVKGIGTVSVQKAEKKKASVAKR